MARAFGNLGDLFPETHIHCRVKGCDNAWPISGEEAMKNVARGQGARPDRMCDECYTKFLASQDQQVPCSKSGCENTWLWNRFQQLESALRGHTSPPRGLCPSCQTELSKTTDKEMPCRMRGCKKTWTWPRKQQMMSEDNAPPRRLCEECYSKLRGLEDRQVPCRMKGCENTWPWNRYQQLENELAGHSLDTPPLRMCDDCFRKLRELHDTELVCRVKGCERNWVYSKYEQLERALAGEEKAPERMCKECYTFFRQTEDRGIPCRHRGCGGTWTATRMFQLSLWLKGDKSMPRRLCDTCVRKLATLQDKEVECMVPGCSETWTHSASDQLRDDCARKKGEPQRRCKHCEEFLASREAVDLPCPLCERKIHWSAYEQLLCDRGTFDKPTACPECMKQKLALEKPREEEKREHHHVIRMPSAGRWHEDERIRDWPVHMTHDVLERSEQAALRVVAIGDDLTWSAADGDQAWPQVLQGKLDEMLGDRGQSVVVNAGIPLCTTAQGLTRFPRDVDVFDPDLLIFSFSFADAFVFKGGAPDHWHRNFNPDRLEKVLAKFCLRVKRLRGKAVAWIPNPVFPHDDSNGTANNQGDSKWASEQAAALEHVLVQTRHACRVHDIPVLDLRVRFEVNGERSARKWMQNWFLHNESGARNIATWFAGHIRHEGLLPDPPSDSADSQA
ncbi:MAG: hypothetical protein KAI66_12795 [Lentisphaeria bacterium]|nr:hypothetical protein [Lentisphaeria bacterium]